uniref:Uncharacterized protein n=1 Tax=Strongyloides papillosus TaxID=174720 RepID=A0A0N5C6B7_STREA
MYVVSEDVYELVRQYDGFSSIFDYDSFIPLIFHIHPDVFSSLLKSATLVAPDTSVLKKFKSNARKREIESYNDSTNFNGREIKKALFMLNELFSSPTPDEMHENEDFHLLHILECLKKFFTFTFKELSEDDLIKLKELLDDTRKFITIRPFLINQNITLKWHLLLDQLPQLAEKNKNLLNRRIIAIDSEESIESLHSICNNYSKMLRNLKKTTDYTKHLMVITAEYNHIFDE